MSLVWQTTEIATLKIRELSVKGVVLVGPSSKPRQSGPRVRAPASVLDCLCLFGVMYPFLQREMVMVDGIIKC